MPPSEPLARLVNPATSLAGSLFFFFFFLVHRLAGDAQWRRLLTDPGSGMVRDYGTTRYRPPTRPGRLRARPRRALLRTWLHRRRRELRPGPPAQLPRPAPRHIQTPVVPLLTGTSVPAAAPHTASRPCPAGTCPARRPAPSPGRRRPVTATPDPSNRPCHRHSVRPTASPQVTGPDAVHHEVRLRPEL